MSLASIPAAAPVPVRERVFGWFAALARKDASAGSLLAAAFLPVGALALLVWRSPATIVSAVHADVFIPIDAGWRWLEGQVPHVDFHAPVGSLYFMIQGLALAWAGDGRSVMWANLLVLPVVLLAGALVVPRRFGAVAGWAVLVFLGVATLSPHYLDWGMWHWGHLASYNRHSWVLLGLVALVVLVEPKRLEGRGWEAADAVVCGLLLLALVHVKATAALAGAGLAFAGAALSPRLRARALLAVASAAAATATLQLAGFETGYLADLRATAAVTGEVVRWRKIPLDLRADGALFAMTLITFWPALFGRSPAPGLLPAFRRPLLALFFFLGALLAVSNQNHDHVALLLPLAAAMGLEHQRRTRIDAERLSFVLAAAVAAFLLLGIPETGSIVLCWAEGMRGAYTALDQTPGSTSPYRAVGFLDAGGASPLATLGRAAAAEAALSAVEEKTLRLRDFREIVADGAAALERFAPGRGRVEAAMNASPFAAWTKARPATGVQLWYDVGRTLTPRGPTPGGFSLEGVDVFMIPTAYPSGGAGDRLEAFAAGELARDFRLAGRTALWRIYVRRAPR